MKSRLWPSPQRYQYPFFFGLSSATVLVCLLTIPVGRSQNNGTLRGVVTDKFSVVIPAALVSLYSLDRVLQTTSDGNGRFEFVNAPSGTYELDASVDGFQQRKFEGVRIPENGSNVVPINLLVASQPSDCGKGASATYERAASGKPALIGIVRDYAGGPVGGFKIRLSKASATRVLASQRSNEKGEFEFRDIEPGQYVVRASRKRNWAYSDTFWITRENNTRVTLGPLRRGSIIICQ